MIVAKAFLFISFVSAHKYSLKKCKKGPIFFQILKNLESKSDKLRFVEEQ